MLSCDTLKFSVSPEAISPKKGKYQTLLRVDEAGELVPHRKTLQKSKGEYLGLGVLDFQREQVVCEISAKVLHGDYFRGITLDTVEQAVERIASYGVAEIDTGLFLETAKLFRVDVTNNVPVGDVTGTLRELWACSVNQFYETEMYPKRGARGQDGIAFKGRGERLIAYDKEREMRNKKESLHLDAPRFAGVLRVESSFRKLDAMRKRFDVEGEPQLLDVLKSNRNPNLETLDNILGDGEVQAKRIEVSDMFALPLGYGETKRLFGMWGIIERLGGDEGMIEAWVRSRYSGSKSKPSRAMKEMRDELVSYRRSLTADRVDRVDELRRLLAA